MNNTLSRDHRRQLEATVARARVAAEAGAAKALQALGVGAAKPPTHLDILQRSQRVALRAHGQQIGDGLRLDGTQSVDHLIVEVAYEHWHRMLFARFLAESDLLLHPDGYPVTLADCKEDAPHLVPPARSEWDVAGRFASAMLPNVFRPGAATLALQLPLEAEQQLEAELAALPRELFAADDSLGWSYQFWQAPRKKEVQRAMKQAGTKVGADELPAVTQLFTEPYMVAFLLENSLGAWWSTRFPGQPLPVAMPYFRTTDDGKPAAGDMPGWPKGEGGQPASLAGFKLLDPCLGSGHFLVAVLHYLVPLRCAAEGLSIRDAVDRVLAENLHGLELDPRCVEIAAFALALAAWRYVGDDGLPLGHRPLPRLNIACCGVAPRAKRAQWLALAGGDRRLEAGMDALYQLFQQAPELGSLIDPSTVAGGGLFDARWDELAGLLEAALGSEGDGSEADAEQREAVIAAQGMAASVQLLSQRYQWVVTNPPYLKSADHGQALRLFAEKNYQNATGDIANIFLERSIRLAESQGVVQFVMPQNWLFLTSYKKQRECLLKLKKWILLARLGEGGFDSNDAAGAFIILFTIENNYPVERSTIKTLDASAPRGAVGKAEVLRGGPIIAIDQCSQTSNPDSRVVLEDVADGYLLQKFATSYQGIKTSDDPQFVFMYWEVLSCKDKFEYYQGTVDEAIAFGGRSSVILFESGAGRLRQLAAAQDRDRRRDQQGASAWAKPGIAVSLMRELLPTIYTGEKFDANVAVLCPKDELLIPALWCFCKSIEFNDAVRKIDQSIKVTNSTLGKIPFYDLRKRNFQSFLCF